jgi:hypothetical protein
MGILIAILAIYGLAFFLKETSGPFGIMDKLRNLLMLNKYIGKFFFDLLSCYFCLGFHCGWLVYLLAENNYTWQFFILWALAGGAVSLIIDGLVGRLHRE